MSDFFKFKTKQNQEKNEKKKWITKNLQTKCHDAIKCDQMKLLNTLNCFKI